MLAVAALAVAAVVVARRREHWFWSPGWQAGEVDADVDLNTGAYTRVTSNDELRRVLAERAHHGSSSAVAV